MPAMGVLCCMMYVPMAHSAEDSLSCMQLWVLHDPPYGLIFDHITFMCSASLTKGDEDMKVTVLQEVLRQAMNFFVGGIHQLVCKWDACLSQCGKF